MFTVNDLWGLILGGGVALLCLILGCVLLSGRGANMIAGYNIMTPNEKATWNKRALCKAVGIYMVFLGIVTGAIIVTAFLRLNVAAISLAVAVLVLTILFIIFININKRFRV